ncbi:N,N-dimethylformamidase beta subunit family domain-containing protein [Nocardioides sp. LS1]|uniref:N,N-dimethylformamidase beta subunit family domain-containing protein n=1 Tax=Nocardioides sp. LS1 TaxID=1027620 RepID=UPI000F627EFC|nr:N,N-dimethylformamidase beta subunit family domain-containing protein [Nocardioides sp. LS1]GCD92153.1 hypothetical protein NLS1_41590 [Nocardioides sp. LS1]
MLMTRTRRQGTTPRRTRRRAATWLAVLAGALVTAFLTVVPAQVAVAAPCDAPVVSPVACENTKTGNPQSEWGITGAGSSSIQGFATQMSVNVGETEGFKIDTPATSYRLDIYRMGYYGGMGARLVATVNPTTIVTNQPNCLNDTTTGLIDCGNWTQNASWTVPATAVSGIYFAKLVRTDGTTGASHVFFVVRNDNSSSKILVQTSDTTWQAYNQYGGNSLYVGSPAGRAYKVSYNRPFTTRDTSPEDFVFNSEYPMVRWLESNGYDVSYTSGVDTATRGAELLEHKVFMSVGHDEYWSGQQRANVEAARAAGVNLAFFSGNEIFWKTRWEPSIAGPSTPNRTLVTYKETHANAPIDPQDPTTWTGTWRDPRFSPPADGGRPENALSGQIFTANCCAINMVVGSADGKMRFWRNTRVATLGTNATTTIGSSVIGYEWDQDADNGSRPAGLFRVSQTTGSAEVLQDYGSTYASGTATHSMTMYKAPSGALVFGAGTIQWPWALDANHDRGSAAADTAARQATVNLLADMGVQPTTLQSGLVAASASTDTTAPVSAITAPANNANVPVGGQVTVTGTATDTGGQVGGIEVSVDGGTTWHRATGRAAWTYTFTPAAAGSLTIKSRATDDSGNIETPKPGNTLVVGNGGGPVTCPCSIWPSTTTPAGTDPDTSSVELGVKFRANQDGFITGIRYYKPTTTNGTHVGTLWTGTGTKLATATFTNETASGWQQADFSSPVAITANTTYVASYFTPARYAVNSAYFAGSPVINGPLTALQNGTDGGNGLYRYTNTAGVFPNNTFNSENYWVDVVYTSGVDTTKPTLSARTPASGATNVSVGVAPTATFSEAVTPASISFTLKDPAGAAVAATTAYDATSKTSTLTPGAPLAASTTYTATVSGAADAAGNVMDPATWTFTTAAADTTKPTLTSRTPAPGATNVPVGTTATAVFSEPVTAGSITFTLKNPAGVTVAATTAYNAGTQTATLTPSAALATSTAYTASVSGATDPSGNVMDPVTWTFTTAAPTNNNCPCTIWPSTATPAGTDPDTSAVELGVKFRTSTAGFITGIRYYKPTQTSGTHVGSLWTSTGTQLATVAFTGETASGWQQATFASPVPVQANTTYVASYFTPSRYAVNSAYFSSATTRGPLTALQNGTDGGNGLYRYTSTAGAFPNNTYNSENYWVDVVFTDTASDTTPPSLQDRSPAVNATAVPVNTTVTATYNEPLKSGSAAVEVRNPAGQLVAGTTTYDTANTRVVFTPTSSLSYSTTYTVQVIGASDASNNVAPTATWSFQTAAPPPPPPDQGPGGPIAVVTSSTVPVSTYLAEILRAEGLNEFTTMGTSGLTAANLANFKVVVLGNVPVDDTQVAALTTWVNGGGDLILMRPDSRFLSLAGLTAASGSVSEGYLAVDATSAPGAGITTDTMQFHGTADRYTLSGATTVATLYSSATASTGQPAVTWRSVGTNGGQVAAFAFDLASSIVQTRQGNQAWAGTERDGQTPIRSDDQFFGGASTDWVNLSKVFIPQADEQQRLLANLITVMSRDKLPMPRFWYFPDTTKAVVVATGDDHAGGGTAGRFDAYLAASPAGCSVAAWTCPRFTSYVYPSSPLTNAQASTYNAQGFEIGVHPQNNCTDYTSLANLQGTYSTDLANWRSKYTSIASPTTNRFHCIVWSDWASQPKAELANGIRLDTNYYFWPPTWVLDRPGFMNGSGMPMRLTDTDGTMLDVYQAATSMTDESGQSYPFTPDTLLDRALGPLGYYGAFTANMHTDASAEFQDSALLASAQSRGVPVIAARQLLAWTDGRNGSSFGNLAWSGGNLTFTMAVGTGASRLTAMLPTTGPSGLQIASLSRGGTSVAFTKMTVKGQEYAVFPAAAGSWTATYTTSGSLTAGPARVTATRETGATVAWSTTRAATSTVLVGASGGSLSPVARADRTTQHRVVLSGLRPGATYRYRVVSRLPDGTTRTWPAYGRPAATFRTRAVDTVAPTISKLRTISLPDGTARVSWQTSEPSDSLVKFGQTALPLLGAEARRDGELVRHHTVVLTGLDPTATYWLSAESADAAGNSASTSVVALDTGKAGVALQSSQFLTGTLSGDLRLGDDGFGALTLPNGGRGTFESTTQDSRLKGDWRQALVEDSGATGARVAVAVRTGSSAEPDGSWTGWRTVATDGSTFRSPGRYLQFRVTLVAPTGTAYSVTAVGFTHDGTPPEVIGEGD